jgi:hypothetical protein
MNTSITYNDKSNMLLNSNLGMLYTKKKKKKKLIVMDMSKIIMILKFI